MERRQRGRGRVKKMDSKTKIEEGVLRSRKKKGESRMERKSYSGENGRAKEDETGVEKKTSKEIQQEGEKRKKGATNGERKSESFYSRESRRKEGEKGVTTQSVPG